MARAAVVHVTGASTGGGRGVLPGEPHADAMALATAVRRLPKAYKLGADRVAQLGGDYAALDHAAIEAVAGAPVQFAGATNSRRDLARVRLGYRRAGAATMWPECNALPIVFGTDRKSGALCVAVSDRKSRRYHEPGPAGQSDRWLHAARRIQGRQTGKSVSDAPWNTRRIFGGTFIIKCYGGNVYKRAGKARFPLHKLYRPAIPRDQSRDAADTKAPAVLAKSLDQKAGRLLAR